MNRILRMTNHAYVQSQRAIFRLREQIAHPNLDPAIWPQLRGLAAQVAAHDSDFDPLDAEEQILADLDAAIFDAEYDLARGDKTARARLPQLNRTRSRILRAWHSALGAAEYRHAKRAELADAPDAATAADAVSRWGLLNGRRTPKPLPPAEPPFELPTATRRDLHAAVEGAVNRFFTEADAGQKPRTLVVAQTGSRKTGLSLAALKAAMERRKEAGLPWRAVWLVPEHRLSAEAHKRATREGIYSAVFRGRSAETCQNLEATKLARQAGADIKRTVCGPAKEGQCFARNWCGAEGYFAFASMAADADLVIASHNFITESLPEQVRKNVAFVVIDEDFAGLIDWEREITRETFTADPLEKSPVRDEHEQPDRAATDELAAIFGVIHRAIGACVGGYLTAQALADAGFGALDMYRARQLIWGRKVPVLMHAGMDPDARRDAAKLAAVNGQLPGLASLTYALERVASGDPAAGGLISVRLDERRGGSQVVVTIRGQRETATWLADLPVLMLSATGRLDDVQRAFPDAGAAEIARAAEPYSAVHQIVGAFGRSTLGRHKTRMAELQDSVAVAMLGRRSGLVVTHKAVENAFTGMPGVATAHHGAITGHDAYANVETAFVIGGAFASPEAVASLAAARGAGAVTVAKPERVTRSALLTSGQAVEIDVMEYEDPAVDAVHRGIYDTSIIQAAGRVRPLERTADNPCVSYVFANVALPFPVDTVIRWQDVRPDRLVRMIAGGAVWFNANDMATFRPDLFKTAKAAEHARSKFAGTIADMREAVMAIVRNDVRAWSQVTYQLSGQGQKQRFVLAPEGAEAAIRHAVEADHGTPITWRVRRFTAGKKDTPIAGKEAYIPVAGDSSDWLFTATDAVPLARMISTTDANAGDMKCAPRKP